ncbi:winged helix DNA-binding domain-containing protein [Flavobacterium sp. Fl-318]|uniref:Winged helix DNA-binding domain-containing protein n=1 Tax=Flavobacterium cupriresistens TaxID=2893885 RepID=A0ABU4RCM1_9FLAO|nr:MULTISPECIES: winged helix DNA-binding domain-containing protein [unclassified Flavobacterium]MDX6190343.1 winged helix DNA-binding domain-containing protein [Flavobacterium sp. Fl-318]UFH43410.1 winged helix DNA-binding domain-containing protein [Flavobacterium sp. F-323]
MTHPEIALLRMASQKILKTTFHEPQEIVHHLGAMQAQDYTMAKWAIGSRCDASEKMIEEAINSGQIIRTHILRPTWHFVSATDIHWMLDISGPQVKKIILSAAKKYDLDEKKLKKINNSIEKILSNHKSLTREEIIRELGFKKETDQNFSSTLIMGYAELDGVVCNGNMKGRQITYSLLEEKVPKTKTKLTKEEGLARLAKRYFESHGPATLPDFIWWSGFPATVAKLAVLSVESELDTIEVDGTKYWFKKGLSKETSIPKKIHFLPSFDEILISYKTREITIAKEHQPNAFTNNGIFWPIIIENEKVIGTWKRTAKKEHTKIETSFFETINPDKKNLVFEAIKPFENYLESKISIE